MKLTYFLQNFNCDKMKRNWIILLSALVLNVAQAQDELKVTFEKLDVNGYNAQFTEDGEGLVFTTQHFKGLKLYDLKAKRLESITEELGAGYNVKIQKGQVIFPKSQIEGTFACFDLNTRKLSVFEPTSNVQKAASAYRTSDQSSDNRLLEAKPSADLRKIELTFANGLSKMISPLGDNDYLNVGISPNGEQLVFRVSGVGSFVTDLDGKIIKDLGNVEFPRWAGDDQVLFTETKDDGYHYIQSEIYLSSLKSAVKTKLTATTSAIALYPQINRNFNKVVFNTPEGELFLIHLSQ